MSVQSPLIVALDVPDLGAARKLLQRLDPADCRIKIGKELFTRAGPAAVEAAQQRGFEVFLDLKFHDIPNTVAAAVGAAADLGVWMLNVHAAGGPEMLTAASERLAARRYPPLLIAVTVLTSMDRAQLKATGVADDPAAQVQRLASLALEAGLDGLVCSAREAPALREAFGAEPVLVTPGIRPAGSDADDQRRILEPAQAVAAGSSYLVIGRPVTRSDDPAAAVKAINTALLSRPSK